MKKTIYLFIFLLIGLQHSFAGMIEDGDEAYNSENYPEAIELYNQAIDTEGTSATLLYNLGNAYYRNGEIAKAILQYERALKLDPSYSDAKYNLSFIRQQYNLEVEQSSATTSFVEKLTELMHPNTWAITSLIIFFILLTAIASYIFLSNTTARKIAFFSAILLLPITVCAILITTHAHTRATSSDRCVVISQSSQLSTVPSRPVSQKQKAFTVPSGFTMKIVDSVDTPKDSINSGWYEVVVEGDRHAWVSYDDVEII